MAEDTFDVFGPEGDLKADDLRLRDLYQRVGVPLDLLPYTPEFERLYEAYVELTPENQRPDRAWVFRRMLGLRKSGRLPRLVMHGGGDERAA